ncbi:lipoprotein-releasing system ATP-binding protein LolD [Aliifodinibius salipaludis]|uniref:Lipoprotein-releasing system ATP-binding protein LolD n=1 Tax=Fodinibius salipaludis TaxID=2032627 RepID=A0A2A2G7S8_9BACT|nr:ABC transporter ATP-binding protein [Aliifodinibius salipaludis]PAU92887.1 lipoprotein-releasing system ATP-binding protein LolD [Aliifodinibius salipaludis]
MQLITIKNLFKTYRLGDVEVSALRGLSLSIEQGEFVALYGASGSGKTTLLNIIACIDAPSSGKVFYEQKQINYSQSKKLGQFRLNKIGFVFQSYNLVPVLNTYENIEYPLLLTAKSEEERKQLVENIIDQVGLTDVKGHKPRQLSGGQRQRVAIGRALVNKPKLVIADEPTANLDVKTSRRILELLTGLNEVENTTFLIATHDPLVKEYVGRSIMIRDGKIRTKEHV